MPLASGFVYTIQDEFAVIGDPPGTDEERMKPPDFEYARPTSIAEAVTLLAAADGEGKILAGGQSLVPLLNFRLAAPRLLVDINRITELDYVRKRDGWLEVGAATRMRTLELDPLVRETAPVIATAATWVGHVQIRNRGTVGGSIAHADPAAELPAVCLLLDAEIVVAGPGGERRIAANDLFSGFLSTTLAENEVLTEVRFPLPAAGDRFGFREFAHRRGDFALAGAAVSLAGRPGGAIDRARIAVFGTADRPVRATVAEEALHGRTAEPGAFAAAGDQAAEEAATDDPRPDANYRRTLIATLVRRALEEAAGQSAAGGRRGGA
jgi:carbon-monoxide dehydrogenase medium subunit